MSDLLRLRDHSQPCEHEYPDGAQPDTVYGGVDWEQGQTARKVWKCNTFGCPGGREITLRKISKTHARSAVSEAQADSVYVEVTDDE